MGFKRLTFATGTALALLFVAACGSDPGDPPGDATVSAGPHGSHSVSPAGPPQALRQGERFVDLSLPQPYTPAAPSGGTDEYRCFVVDPKLTEPAYLTGSRGFWSLELQVTPATLIPRPETELLVELALARLPQTRTHTQRVADLGTGSGAIALAIARERPLAQIVATDASEQALAVAAANAAAHAIGSVQFSHGSWWEPLAGQHFDLVASNPPYIAEGDRHLEEGDLRFEPAAALSSGIDGLDAIRQIVAGAGLHLHAGGWLLLEHGWEQAAAVRALLVQAGFREVASERDLESRERVTLGRWFP